MGRAKSRGKDLKRRRRKYGNPYSGAIHPTDPKNLLNYDPGFVHIQEPEDATEKIAKALMFKTGDAKALITDALSNAFAKKLLDANAPDSSPEDVKDLENLIRMTRGHRQAKPLMEETS